MNSNHILQINVNTYNSYKYIKNGIILNFKSGYVLSTYNRHNNDDIIFSNHPLFGIRPMDLTLLSVCPAKNLALYKLSEKEIKLFEREKKTSDTKCADYLKLKIGDNITIIEYINNILNVTKTSIKSFDIDYANIEDSLTRKPYMININNDKKYIDGSGVFNNNHLIGIINDNKIIPIRTFLAIYNKMMEYKVVKVPNISLSWNETNRELMAAKTGNEGYYGIYVRSVMNDSCIQEIIEGDIIFEIKYITENMDINFKFEENKKINEKESLNFESDRYGNFKIYPNDGLTDRKLCLAEVIDLIPIDSKLLIQFCRDGKIMALETIFENIDARISYKDYLPSNEYEILAGIKCKNLSLEHIKKYPQLKKYLYDNSYIIITKIFPGSLIDNIKSFQKGDIINEINKVKVRSISKLKRILNTNPEAISIKTIDNTYFVSTKEKIIDNDLPLLKYFPDYEYSLK